MKTFCRAGQVTGYNMAHVVLLWPLWAAIAQSV